MKKQTLVVLETATTGCGHLVFESARELNAEVIFLAKTLKKYSEIPRIEACLQGDSITCKEIDTTDTAALLKFLTGQEVHGIFTSFDGAIEAASLVAEERKLPFLSNWTVTTCRNKRRLANLCNSIGFNAAPVTIGEDGEPNVPVVVKPQKGTGSMNAKLCHTREEAIIHSDVIKETGDVALIQEFVPGPLVSVETFTYGGKTTILGITDRIMGSTPNFVEVGWSFPVTLGRNIDMVLSKLVVQLLAALKVSDAVCHTEFIITGNGPILIEVNPRIGGMRLSDAMQFSCGKSVYVEMIRMHLGSQPCVPSSTQRGMMEYHIYAPFRGRLNAINGIKFAEKLPGIVKIEQYPFCPGSEVEPPKDFRGQKLATVIAVGDSVELAKANCFNAVSHIQIDISHSVPG